MKLNAGVLKKTLGEYENLVTTLRTCQTEMRVIAGNLSVNWQGTDKEEFVFGLNKFLDYDYETLIYNAEGTKEVLKDTCAQANATLNRCDDFENLLQGSNQSMTTYSETRSKGGTLLMEEENISSVTTLSEDIAFTQTENERKKLKQAMGEISFCDCSTLKYSNFDLNAEKIVLESYLQKQSDALADFAQSVRTYQQEVEALETGAVKNFSKYTSSAGKGASRKMYQPAINKQGEFNKDRIMYLMNTPISAMTEEEMKELTDTYTTLADKQDYASMAEFLECCYEFDESETTRNTTFKLTETYYDFVDGLEVALKEAGNNSGLNLMENNCKNGEELYNEATKQFLKQLEGFAILKGLGTHKPTISYGFELFNANKKISRNEIEIKPDKNGAVNNYTITINGKDYIVLGWDDDHDGALDEVVINTNNSLKRDKEQEVSQYFLDIAKGIVIDKVVGEAAKKVPGAGQAYQAVTIMVDIDNLCKEIDEYNGTLDSQNSNLSSANIWNYLGMRVCASVAEGQKAEVYYSQMDPVETRARVAWAKRQWKKDNPNNKEEEFGLGQFCSTYSKGQWENFSEEEKEKYYKMVEKDKNKPISSIDDLF